VTEDRAIGRGGAARECTTGSPCHRQLSAYAVLITSFLVVSLGDDVLVGGPGQDSFVCGAGEDQVVVEFFRHVEHFGDGCEAAIFDV
jgi:hypothetical protein